MKDAVTIEEVATVFVAIYLFILIFQESEIAFKKTNWAVTSDDECNHDKQTFLSLLYS